MPGPINNEGYYYEVLGNIYIYAYSERGHRTVICKTEDINEFYYSILKDIVKNYAINYEVKNRIINQDTRRIWMKKALEWMNDIDVEFYKKMDNEFSEILKLHPFKDQK
ncbi:MAG: Imm63 family immunity protein [Oscillospiraceae bacterium]|nr:Imm63 family immunity protein [Oscillospiraceae bacterium]